MPLSSSNNRVATDRDTSRYLSDGRLCSHQRKSTAQFISLFTLLRFLLQETNTCLLQISCAVNMASIEQEYIIGGLTAWNAHLKTQQQSNLFLTLPGRLHGYQRIKDVHALEI